MMIFSENLNVCLVIICALFTLCPILTITDGRSYPIVEETMVKSVKFIQHESPIMLTSIFIVVIPAADLLLDCISHLFRADNPLKKAVKKGSVVRLTDIERLLFILGVGMQSSKYFLRSTSDLYTFGLVTNCIEHSNAILLLGPIITFLGRCTVAFTPVWTFFLIMCVVVGLFFRSFAHFVRNDPVLHIGLQTVGSVTLMAGCLIYGCLITFCARGYYLEKFATATERQACLDWLFRSFKGNRISTDKKVEAMTDCESDLYTNYIPALHIISSITILVSTSFVVLDTQVTFLTLFAEIVVLVIELRIRKNEIARGLVALLHSKKSYVRYISHELRTPLNTAFLGLKLLTSELKVSTNAKDAERYDILCDVNMSCTAAVDILNDLLCYEKLESGRMELHKEDVSVAPFLGSCVSLFSAESTERGVAISLELDSEADVETGAEPSQRQRLFYAANNGGPESVCLEAYDSIFVDRFKMDQVIRNLISNALKFTPRGGEVTIKATFEYSPSLTRSRDEVDCEYVHAPSWSDAMKSNVSYRLQRLSSSFRTINPSLKDSVPQILTLDTGDSISGKLVVVVSDTGAGISLENQKRLFKEIIQFSPEKLQAGGGSGLGLWITAGILDLHDGSIRVHSDGEGAGTSFTVEMPMTRHRAPFRGATYTSTPADGDYSNAYDVDEHDCESKSMFALESEVSDKVPHPTCSALSSLVASPQLSPIVSHRKVVVKNAEVEVVTGLPREGEGHIAAAQEKVKAKEKVKEEEKEKVGSGRSYNVLVVDDSRLNRKMLTKCLRAAGHTCCEAEDGLQAIAMVQETMMFAATATATAGEGVGGGVDRMHLDAILMDFVMPNMDGPSATREIRSLGYTGTIFGVTGNGLSSDVNHFLSCGADRVLLKPLDMDAFHAAMSLSSSRCPSLSPCPCPHSKTQAQK